MELKKGKVIFHQRELWCLDLTLNKIILSGLISYKDMITQEDSCKGVPSTVVGELIEKGVIEDKNSGLSEEDIVIGFNYFLELIDKMIYAFKDNPLEDHLIEDLDKHNKLCEEGRLIFAKHYTALWY